MGANRIDQALVLAHHGDGGLPLALMRTGGVPHLKRVLLTLQHKGVRRFFVVTGRHHASIRAALADDPALGDLDITWVAAPGAGSEGEAACAARPLLHGAFLLVCGNRVFAADIVDRLQQVPHAGVTLAVEGEAWVGLASCDITVLDGIDGSVGLQQVFDRLAAAGCVLRVDVAGCFWHVLQGKASRREADRLLLDSLRKPEVDGIIARHINRRVSLLLTRLLMHTDVRPNHVTFVALLVSLGAGVVAAMASSGSVWMLTAGAALWQLASILDGTDGEIARLKFQTSQSGEWFDTIVDDAGRIVFFLGIGYGMSAVTGDPLWFRLMFATSLVLIVLLGRIYTKLRKIGAGSHYALAWTSDHDRPQAETTLTRFWQRIEFLSRRDYYVFAFFVLTSIGLPTVAIAIAALTTGIVIIHEIHRPRQPRDHAIVEAVLMHDNNHGVR